MRVHRTCQETSRRDFIKAGVCGGLGLALADPSRSAATGQRYGAGRATSAIFITLSGGPSHLDTFDLKPDAPREYRGEFQPIRTNVSGVEFCEHLPKLAQCADKFVILRGVGHPFSSHRQGTEYVNTGMRPEAALQYPSYGAVVTKETEASHPPDLPPFVAIPDSNQLPGFLGIEYAPWNTGATPVVGQPFCIFDATPRGGLDATDVEQRQRLLRSLDTGRRGGGADIRPPEDRNRVAQQMHEILTSNRSRAAFDISRESPNFARPFGAQPFGASCLLAVRLVESGVRFVALTLGGWDTHQNHFTRLKGTLLPTLDTGLAALLNGLSQKGLLDSTTVFVTGEFGRTPKISNHCLDGGRDHYSRCMFVLMAGGGIRGGQAVGKSDDKGTQPDGIGFSPEDVAATFYYTLGIGRTTACPAGAGRLVPVVPDGRIIRELVG